MFVSTLIFVYSFFFLINGIWLWWSPHQKCLKWLKKWDKIYKHIPLEPLYVVKNLKYDLKVSDAKFPSNIFTFFSWNSSPTSILWSPMTVGSGKIASPHCSFPTSKLRLVNFNHIVLVNVMKNLKTIVAYVILAFGPMLFSVELYS